MNSIQMLEAEIRKDNDGFDPSVRLLQYAEEAAKGLGTVITYILTDAFCLNAEESISVSLNLANILKPLHQVVPSSVLISVDKEMRSREFSERLMKLVEENEPGKYLKPARGVQYAPLSDWLEWIGETVLINYPTLRPMIRSSIIGSMHGLLTELGLSEDLNKTRASTYLPASVRYMLNRSDED